MERRVKAMTAAGLDHSQIAERIRRSPAHVERVIGWSQIPRSRPPTRRSPRAVERRVLDLRSAGESHAEIASRFKRSERSIRQIEGLAHFRLAMDLLERQESSS
jgi:DNA-binding CsgD family transcriptional regulator